MILVIKTIQDFDALEEQWNKVFDKCSTATPYQRFIFNKITWETWKSSEDSLYIICYSQNGDAQYDAIMPCYINRDNVLRFIDFHSDFCDIIVSDDYADKYDMYCEIVKHIKGEGRIRSVCLNNLKQNSRLSSYLYALGGYTKLKCIAGYSIVRMLPTPESKDFIDTINNCKSPVRNKLRRCLRDNAKLEFKTYSNPLPFPYESIQIIAASMIKQGIRENNYLNGKFIGYFKSLYESGNIVVTMNFTKDIPVSANFFLKDPSRNEYISWVTIYKNMKYNLAILLFSMDYMYKEGFYNLNLARGLYEYKLSHFHPSVYTLNRLQIFKTYEDAAMDEANWFERYIIQVKSFLRRTTLFQYIKKTLHHEKK